MATRTATKTRTTTPAQTMDIPIRVVRGLYRVQMVKAAREAEDEYAPNPTFDYWLERMVDLRLRMRDEGVAQPQENKPKAPAPVEAEADGRPEAVGE